MALAKWNVENGQGMGVQESTTFKQSMHAVSGGLAVLKPQEHIKRGHMT